MQGVVAALDDEAKKFSIILSRAKFAVLGRVVPANNGTFAGSFSATIAGVYSLSLTYGNSHLIGSPFTLQVSASRPDPAKSKVISGPVVPAVAGVPFDVYVQPADVFANLLQPSDLRVEDRILGSCYLSEQLLRFPVIKAWNNASQGLPVSFLLTIAGRFSAAIALNENNISGSPFVVVVIAGPTAAQYSYITVSERQAVISAGVPFVFRINSYDAVSHLQFYDPAR